LPEALTEDAIRDALRVIAGDFSGGDWFRIGGIANALALLLFVLGTAASVVRGRRRA
jgi:hypothetical protein